MTIHSTHTFYDGNVKISTNNNKKKKKKKKKKIKRGDYTISTHKQIGRVYVTLPPLSTSIFPSPAFPQSPIPSSRIPCPVRCLHPLHLLIALFFVWIIVLVSFLLFVLFTKLFIYL